MESERNKVLTYEEVKQRLNGFKGFKLLQLELVQHPVLGSIFYDFVDSDELGNGPYATLILGPNGTGKSYLLRTIIDIFRRIHSFADIKSDKPSPVKGGFHIVYCLDGDIYECANLVYTKSKQIRFVIPNDEKIGRLRKNGETVSADQVSIPTKILASSIMLWDKFLFPPKDDSFVSHYTYMGIRSSQRSAGTQDLIRRTVDSIVSNINGRQLIIGLGEMLKFLGYNQKMSISYVPKYRSMFWNQDISYDEFIDMFENWSNHFIHRKSPPWGMWYFEKIRHDRSTIEKLLAFMKAVTLKSYGQGGRYFAYEIFSDKTIAAVFPLLVHLSKLDLVSPPSLTFAKNDQRFQLAEASSGEVQIITSLVGLLAAIEPNSLILLDEPEISLHPNMQMQFLMYLRKMFAEYETSHFIVASHSHFMVSDLENKSSSIIAVNKNNERKGFAAKKVHKDTFGWSAEQVLLDVFKVTTTRNYMVADRLGELLDHIASEDSSTQSIREKFLTLELNQLSSLTSDDPLKLVYDKIVEEYDI